MISFIDIQYTQTKESDKLFALNIFDDFSYFKGSFSLVDLNKLKMQIGKAIENYHSFQENINKNKFEDYS